MANKPYRAAPASYYFRVIIPNKKYQCAKFPGGGGGDSEVPEATYTLTRYPTGVFCDCPAASHGSGRYSNIGPCKHSEWFKRWEKIQINNMSPGGAPVYYDSAKDKFYPVKFLGSE